jgi:dienelactone hydrolase
MCVVSDVDTDDGRSHPPTSRRRRWWLWAGAAVIVLLAVAAGGFYLWATTTQDPGPRAVSDEQVRVIEDDGYTFQPTRPTRVGFIFYPGGRVDPASYAAPAREIAEAGFLVIVPELTLNLAVLDADAVDDVIAAHPEIEQWVIGGHSLGGTIAASYAGEHRDTISGLVLWAAYPSNGTDLSTLDAAVASAFGTRDGLTTLDDIDDSRNRLPPDTDFVSIQGGNHAQFGDYGPQAGDNPATVSRDEQQAQAIQASLRILNAIE